MGAKKFYAILVLLSILVSVSPVYAREYSLKSATADVVVEPNGLVFVTETITYSFTGTYNEVFRRIYPPPGGSIRGIKIRCEDQPCKERIDQISGGFELVGELPKPTPSEIDFIVSYYYYGGLKVYDDISELHYKLWGEEWDQPLQQMKITVKLPPGKGEDPKYWLHPKAYTKGDQIKGDTITIVTGKIPANSWYEIRVAFPRLETIDARYVRIEKGSGLEKIMEIEKAYNRKQTLSEYIYIAVWLIALILATIPFIIYYKYGREPEINYHAIYEREPPYTSKPAAVNAILRGKIGVPTMNAFVATFMDLVYMKHLSIKDLKTEKSFLGVFSKKEEDIIITIHQKETDKLLDFEEGILNLLKKHAKDGKLSWNKLQKKLAKDSTFYDFMNHWNNLIELHIKVEDMFISKGNNYLMAFGGIATAILIFGGILLTNYMPPAQFPAIAKVTIPGVIIFIVGIGSLASAILNEKGAGRFTPEGRLYYERWENFRKYLTDFSALKEHPPESIKLWDFYMVYAVALGVAEKVIKNMKLVVPAEQIESSRFHSLHYYPFFFTGFNGSYNNSNPSSSAGGGGVGGIGGGFGGGGGGAR